ncbi:MAG: hypothetical protein E7812_11245 [Phenylobacterium sp.]|nr:MAG: hypothetical protein E7812_11245 [Phenylobacterium sp.]
MARIRELVDIAIDEDPRAPCLWVPTEHWEDFLEAVDRVPNLIGAVIYRNKTIREGPPYSDITTRSPDHR